MIYRQEQWTALQDAHIIHLSPHISTWLQGLVYGSTVLNSQQQSDCVTVTPLPDVIIEWNQIS